MILQRKEKYIVKGMFDSFVYLSEDEWDMIDENLEEVEFKKNEIILNPGEIENYLYFIVKGVVRYFFFSHVNQEYTLGFKSAPNAFSAYTSFVKRQASNVGSQAMSHVLAYRISFDNLEKLYVEMDRMEALSRKFLQFAYIEKEEKEFNLQSKTASEFYRDFCIKYPEIIKQVPQKHIASYMGIAPESLSRIKKEFKIIAPNC